MSLYITLVSLAVLLLSAACSAARLLPLWVGAWSLLALTLACGVFVWRTR